MTERDAEPAVEALWRAALQVYREDDLRARLARDWPGDRNVLERITYSYPPTFQPGYVGPRFHAARTTIVFMGQNPGEGGDAGSVEHDRVYRSELEAFARGATGFEDLNRLVASHMLRWGIFRAKGIFRESGDAALSLVDEELRPSIEEVAYVNAFPLKTSGNQAPLRTPFRFHIWASYVARLLELLAPRVIVPMGSWCSPRIEQDLRKLAGFPEVVHVWHPSDYNVRTRPAELLSHWVPLSRTLRAQT